MPSPESRDNKTRRGGMRPLTLVIATVAFIGAVAAAFLISTKAIGIAIAVTLAMTLVLFACLFSMRGDDRYRVVRHSGDIDFDAMSSMLGAGSFLHKFEMSSSDTSEVRMAGYVSNPTVDRLFVSNPYHVEVVGRYQLPDMMVPYERYLASDIDRDEASPWDDEYAEGVVGLAGDLTTTMLATGKSIPVTIADAHDMMITDGAFDRVVATTGINGTILFDGCSMSIADGGFLLPTSQSGNVNAIMAHSIILTSDGYIAFMEGTQHSRQHEGKVVPSVSCLLHASDIESTASIQDAIVMAIHAATRREYALDETVPLGSSVLGLARIVERNGATEFYAITRVGQTMGQLIAHHASRESVPAGSLMRPLLAGAQDENEMAELLARVAYTLIDSTSIAMSVSLAGLASALYEDMGNNKVKGKIMRRLGYSRGAATAGADPAGDPTGDLMDIASNIATQAMSQGDAQGTGNMGDAVMRARQLTFGNAGLGGNTGAIGNAGRLGNTGTIGNTGRIDARTAPDARFAGKDAEDA